MNTRITLPQERHQKATKVYENSLEKNDILINSFHFTGSTYNK